MNGEFALHDAFVSGCIVHDACKVYKENPSVAVLYQLAFLFEVGGALVVSPVG